MLRNISTRRIGPWEKLEIDFASRLNLFTGDNGFGKTYLLDLVWLLHSRNWRNPPTAPNSLVEIDSSQTAPAFAQFSFGEMQLDVAAHYDETIHQWKIEDNIQNKACGQRSPRTELVIYFGSDGNCSVWDSFRNIIPGDELWWSSEQDRERRYAFHLTASELFNGLPYSNGQGMWCNGLLSDWVLWQLKSNSPKSLDPPEEQPFEVFSKVLEIISHHGEPLTPGSSKRLDQLDSREHPTIDTIYGNVPLVHCSSGIKRIVSLAYAITWAYYEHKNAAKFLNVSQGIERLAIILDEVELHLHPKWQRVILPSLLKVPDLLSDKLDVQIFATTHSPLVLASVESAFDSETDKLFLFNDESRIVDSGKHEIFIEELPWAKFGTASSWLRSNAFGLSDSRSLEAEQALLYAHNFLAHELSSNPEQYQTENSIRQLLESHVASRDPFWARWRGRTSDDQI